MEIKKTFSEVDIKLSSEQFNKLFSFQKLLGEWNTKINLVSEVSTDFNVIHILDSLMILKYIEIEKHTDIADIGSGGGLPVIPLAIAMPENRFTCIDSSKKKMNALSDIIQKLNLSNVDIICDNIEKVGRDEGYRGKFNLVTSRALASLRILIEYGIPLLKLSGRLICYKGILHKEEVENSTNALKKLNGKIVKTVYFILPFTNRQRSIVVVDKLGKTDNVYPRLPGKIKKSPL